MKVSWKTPTKAIDLLKKTHVAKSNENDLDLTWKRKNGQKIFVI